MREPIYLTLLLSAAVADTTVTYGTVDGRTRTLAFLDEHLNSGA